MQDAPGDVKSVDSNLTIEIITSQEEFKQLRTEWNALLAESLRKSFFLTWEWQFQWWCYYKQIETAKALNIVLLRGADGKLQAILPLYISEVNGLPGLKLRLGFLIGSGHESSEYLDIIVSETCDLEELVPVFEAVQNMVLDGLHLSDQTNESILLFSLTRWVGKNDLFAEKRYWKTCPFISLNGTYENFIGSLSKNMRYNVRRRTRNLEKDFSVKFHCIDQPEEAIKTVDVLYALHRKRWDTRDGTSKFDDPVREKFHAHIAAPLLDAGYLRFYVLELNDTPVATLYCFNYDGHVYYYQAGMDPEFEKNSIGMVIMGKAIEASFAENAHEFDFLRGLEEYKFRWTDQTRETYILEVGLSKSATAVFKLNAYWRQLKKAIKGMLKMR